MPNHRHGLGIMIMAAFIAILAMAFGPARLTLAAGSYPQVNEKPWYIEEDTHGVSALHAFDPDGDLLTAYLLRVPAQGKMYQVNPDGTRGDLIQATDTGYGLGARVTNPDRKVWYEPPPDGYGNNFVIFRYWVQDSTGLMSNQQDVPITVTPTPDQPVAEPQSVIGLNDLEYNHVNFQYSDVDLSNPIGIVSVHITELPTSGTLYHGSVSPENAITSLPFSFKSNALSYVWEGWPDCTATVSDSLRWFVEDETGLRSDTVETTITIGKGNCPANPGTTPTSITVDPGGEGSISFSPTDPDGNTDIMVLIASLPSRGTLAVKSNDGTWTTLGEGWTVPSDAFDLDPNSEFDPVYYLSENDPAGYTDSFSYTLVDNWGMRSGPFTVRIFVGASDATPPVTTASAVGSRFNTDLDRWQPYTYLFGTWTAGQVDVSLSADDGTGTGVAATYYKVDDAAAFSTGTSVLIDAPADHSNDGVHTITFYSTDQAGNSESPKSVTVKIDTTKPVITATATTTDGLTYSAGNWTNQDVTVRFRCADGGSGVASNTIAGGTLSSETNTGSVTNSGSCSDDAGNTADSATFGPIRIDLTAPTLNPRVMPDPVILNDSAVAAPGAADHLSGVASASCDAADTSSVGSGTVSCSATDNAGNGATATASHDVTYKIVDLSSQLRVRSRSVAVQLADARDVNQSSAAIAVTAVKLVDSSGNVVTTLNDPFIFTTSGKAGTVGGAYIYALSPQLKKGDYRLYFSAANDPVLHGIAVSI